MPPCVSLAQRLQRRIPAQPIEALTDADADAGMFT